MWTLQQEGKTLSYTKDKLVGLRVYDAKALCLGSVKDIAFTVGQDALSLLVGKEKQQDITLTWKEIQAVGDIIILKASEIKQTPQAAETPSCPSCHQPLTWVEKYKRWYCTKEQKYA